MKISGFLRDSLSVILSHVLLLFFMSLIMFLSNSNPSNIQNIAYANFIGFFILMVFLIYSYFRKKMNYDIICRLLTKRQEDFTASLPEPSTYEQKLYFELLHALNEEYYKRVDKLNNEKKDFINFINYWVHEIKTPVTGSRLIFENSLHKSKEEILDAMEASIDSIENYVQQALYYSRLDSFSQDYLISEVDMEELIKSIVKKYARMFIAKKIRIEINCGAFIVNSDKKWLAFIFEQILLNALKYTGRNGTIKIEGKNDEKERAVVIEDNGTGIKPEDIGRVFDKGFTGQNGRDSLKATGLGLYLSKRLANKLGHDISVTSVYSEFTRVCIRFPLNKSTMLQ